MAKHFLLIALILMLAGPTYAAAINPLAKLLPQTANQDTSQPSPDELSQSLDQVIKLLENSSQRDALLKQLKQLRTSTKQLGPDGKPTNNSVLTILTDSMQQFGKSVESNTGPFAIWQHKSHNAWQKIQHLYQSVNTATHRQIAVEILLGLLGWLALLFLLGYAGKRLFLRRGLPDRLPLNATGMHITAHFFRQIIPWVTAFVVLFFYLQQLTLTTAALASLLTIAYIGMCGRVLVSLADVLVTLSGKGHRRTAATLIRRHLPVPLFLVGALAALSDASLSSQMEALLGGNLAGWLSATSGILAGLLSCWLILQLRRPVVHLLRNQSLSKRRVFNPLRSIMRATAPFWFLPALFFVLAPISMAFWSGGMTKHAFPKAIVCIMLLIITLVITSLLQHQSNRPVRKRRRGNYQLRFLHMASVALQWVLWVAFAELSLRIWGGSLLDLFHWGNPGNSIGSALITLGWIFLISWIVWAIIDTAIMRGLNRVQQRHGNQRANMRAKTFTPMLRKALFAIILIIAGITALSNLGVNITPLLAGAGIIGLAIGFGAQTLVQDLITGIFILVEDSLAIGDFVKISTFMGTVERLNMRSVHLRDLDGVLHIITFSHIDSIHNMSRHFGTALMKIRIPYDLPIDEAITLMKEVAVKLKKDPRMSYLIWSPLEMQGIHSFEDGCAILRMRLKTAPEYQWDVARSFNLLLKREMEARYIKLGAPRMSVNMEAAGGEQFDHPKNSEKVAD